MMWLQTVRLIFRILSLKKEAKSVSDFMNSSSGWSDFSLQFGLTLKIHVFGEDYVSLVLNIRLPLTDSIRSCKEKEKAQMVSPVHCSPSLE